MESMENRKPLVVRYLGTQDYSDIFAKMKNFNEQRDQSTEDEIWLLEHHPVFTQGQAGKEEYILLPGDIPVVKSDRGGHVTYHGPGQITAYVLVDLKRLKLGVRDLVTLIEQALVDTLKHWQISAAPRRDAPGVYTDRGDKIASLGLRIRKGCSYHGLNFNVAMDLSPWQRINPCGLGVAMTQVADLIDNPPSIEQVMQELADNLTARLGYNAHQIGSSTAIVS
ncbi:MAG: lipoyl(octanoyl) transferase LipB [Porticoccaceae bacterium]|nr:lipoyl(octanoyl) transferase LipB [Porticoccaceae bacterium]